MKKNGKQRSLVKIVKNKEILIYKNGKKYKRFKHSETKNLNENEMYILDYLLNKYMGYEVDLESGSENDANIDNNDNNFELNSNDELSQSNQKIKNTFQSNGDEDEEKIESSTLKQIKNKKNKNIGINSDTNNRRILDPRKCNLGNYKYINTYRLKLTKKS